MNNRQTPTDFVATKEYRRFAEFCDACRHYRYVGLCYGAPGVGKTLSARHYANWDAIEACTSLSEASGVTLKALLGSETVLYTPAVVNSPGQVEREIGRLRSVLRSIRVEDRERKQRVILDKALKKEEAATKVLQRQVLAKRDWYSDPIPAPDPVPVYNRFTKEHYREINRLPDPTTLVVIDEADRLKMAALEQVRDIFDKGNIGVILIGMPGIEKRLARYPQLYSRVGFVHSFRPLSAAETKSLLQQKWSPSGISLPGDGVADEEAVAAVIRITGGNFRLLHRLIAQIARILEINELQIVTSQVVEAARESLVIGTT